MSNLKSRIIAFSSLRLRLLRSRAQRRSLNRPKATRHADDLQLEDLTLVARRAPSRSEGGQNPLQFSWANTRIDRPRSSCASSRTRSIVVTRYHVPHDKPQMRTGMSRATSMAKRPSRSLLPSGITLVRDYVAIADKNENATALDGFVRVYNNSGEDYAGCEGPPDRRKPSTG